MSQVKFSSWSWLLFSVAVLAAIVSARGEDGEEPEDVEKKLEWFYEQRAYPHDTLEQGYLLRAYQKMSQAGALRATMFQWTSVGPAPSVDAGWGTISGRIPAIAPHPTNASVVYVGAANGGVWKTVDGGSSWRPLSDFEPSLTSGSLAVDPTNPNIVYCGTGEKYSAVDAYGGVGILKSTDGGETWTVSGLTNEKRISRVTISPTNPSVVFAATWGGLYRSTNAGGSWTLVLPYSKTWEVRVDATSPQFVYAAVGENASYSGIWKSTDGGTTWARLTVGLPASASIRRVAFDIAKSSPSVLYALMASTSPSGGYLGLYVTNNRGATWTAVQDTSLRDIFGPVGAGGQGYYDICLAVHPSNSNIAFAGGRTLRRTTNGGTTWTQMSSNSVGIDHHEIAFGPTWVYAGCDQGIWKSSNNGDTWVNANANLGITQFYGLGVGSTSSPRLYAGSQDCGMIRRDGSSQWVVMFPGDGATAMVEPSDPNCVFWTLTGGLRRRSNDGGLTSIAIQNGIPTDEPTNWVTPIAVNPATANVWYTGTTRLFRSTNRGDLWIPTTSSSINQGLVVRCIAVDPNDPMVLYVGSQSKVFRSTDSGQAWADVSSELPSRYVTSIRVHPQSSEVVFLTLSGTGSGHVFRSANRGTSWTDISNTLPDVPANDLIIDPAFPTTLFLGTDLGMFASTDAGMSWVKDGGFPNTVVAALGISRDRYLYAGTHGRSVWSAKLAGTVPVTTTVSVSRGWGLYSVPVTVTDLRVMSVFPAATSSAATFFGGMYVVRDTLRYREGYWIKFPAAGNVGLEGTERDVDTIHLAPGWNLIGSATYPVPTSAIIQLPAGIVTSGYYGYSSAGYEVASVIQPMRGYWVRARQAGKLILFGMP